MIDLSVLYIYIKIGKKQPSGLSPFLESASLKQNFIDNLRQNRASWLGEPGA